MLTDAHYIKKQIIEVEVSKNVEYWKLQKRLEDIYNEKLLSLLEEVCEKYTQSGENYQLSEMEIDIGEININDIEENLANRVKEDFDKKLAALIHNTGREDNKSIQRESDPNKSKLDFILHFLTTGRYSWPYDTEDISPDSILDELIETVPEKLRELFYKNSNSKKLIKRFIQQFSDATINKTIGLLEESFMPLLKRIFTEIPNILTDIDITYNKQQYRSIVYTAIFELIGNKQNKKLSEKEIENSILKTLFINNKILSTEQIVNLIQFLKSHKKDKQWYSQIHKFFKTRDLLSGTEYFQGDEQGEKIQSGKYNLPKNETDGTDLNSNELPDKIYGERETSHKKDHVFEDKFGEKTKPDNIVHQKEEINEKALDEELKSATPEGSKELDAKKDLDKQVKKSERKGQIEESKIGQEIKSKQKLVDEFVVGEIKLPKKEFEILRKISPDMHEFCLEIKKDLTYINQNLHKILAKNQSVDSEILTVIKEFLRTDKIKEGWKTIVVINVIKSLNAAGRVNAYELIQAIYKRIKQKKNTSKIFTREVLQKLVRELKLEPGKLSRYLNKDNGFDDDFLKTIESDTDEHNIQANKKLSTDDDIRSKAPKLHGSTDKKDSENEIKPIGIDPKKELIKPKKIIDDSELEVVEFQESYIKNAGIILLWPFISSFFKELGYIENNEFKNEVCRNKAIYMLNYPISKTTEISESKLVLNKILCGFPVNEVLEKIDPLTKTEEEQVNKLAESAIENWPLLKNTSLDGFVKSFLIHNGVIRKVDKGWKLNIEREPYDVILDHLPWQLSIVKLPWMEKPIFVEW